MIASERRLRERQQRIHEILESAKRVFRTKGLVNATMLDIAEHSELSRRTIYLYFSNKDEVSLAVAVDTLARLGNSIEEAARQPLPAFERFKRVLEIYLELNHQDPSSFQVILNFDVNVRALGERHELVAKCFGEVARIKRLIAGLLVDGAADGSIKAFPDPKAMASTFITMVQTTLHCAVSSADMLTGPLGIEPSTFIADTFDVLLSYLPAR
jgi:AcrR family transcriptional regulator